MSAKYIKWKRGQYGCSETGFIGSIKVAVIGESLTRGVTGFTVWTIIGRPEDGRFPLDEAKAKAQKAIDSLADTIAREA
jgi:hypothetical protein